MISGVALLAFASLSLFSGYYAAALPVTPGTPSIYVDSDQYKGFEDSSAQLTGHVKIIRGLEQLTSEKAFINPGKNEVTAEGNVLLITPKDYVRAQRMIYNFSTKKGIVYNGFIQTGQETIEGEEIYKLGEQEYSAKHGTYTSCINCPAAWRLSGTKIDASVGSYAYITNPIVRLYGIPILWLPYMVIPIKTERQSGLLPPSFGTGSTDGFTIGESYFWAIDRSRDATLSETNYNYRGLKTGLEYRFVTDKNSFGTFQGNFINDREYGHDNTFINPDPRYNPVPRSPIDSVSRYALRYSQHFELPENFVNNININAVGDTHYPLDFPAEMPILGDAALENRVSLAKNTENTHSSIDVDLYQNLLRADPVGTNDDAIHRVPELKYSIMPTRIFGSPFLARMDMDYVNFSRASSAYDNFSGQPTFQLTQQGTTKADQFRTGQRLSIHPAVTYPLNFGDIFDVLPEIAYEDTIYRFGYSPLPTTNRQYLRGTLDVKTRLTGTFGDDTKLDSHKYKHEIIPEISYTVVPYINQAYHPFFVGSALYGENGFARDYIPHFSSTQPVTEFDNLQFDYRDRLTDINLITFGLSNVLVQKRVREDLSKEVKEGVWEYRQVLKYSLFQSYDFYTAFGPDVTPFGTPINQFPWSPVHSLLTLATDNFDLSSDLSYYWYQRVSAHTTSITLRDKHKNAIQLAYSDQFSPKIDPASALPVQQIDTNSRSQAAYLTTYFTSKYLDFGGTTSYDIGQGQFTNYSLNGIIKPPGKCYGIGAIYTQTLNGPHTFLVQIPIYFGNGKSFNIARPPGI